jgi:hypothetical protein
LPATAAYLLLVEVAKRWLLRGLAEKNAVKGGQTISRDKFCQSTEKAKNYVVFAFGVTK